MIIANAIFYNGQSADKVYLGENLVWEKQTTPPTPTYGSKTFAGKFTDSSTSDKWLWWVNGKSGVEKATNIADKVDPTTKEFNFDYDGTLTSCKYMFGGNSSYSRHERIDHIPDTSQVTDMSWMFASCNDLKSVNLADLDTSQVTNMSCMFASCQALTSLDVSNFDTSKATNMNSMFASCQALTSLDVSNFDTSKATNMNSMFSSCKALTSLDVSNFDTSKVTNMSWMFHDCRSLTTLDVSNFDTSNVTSMCEMFASCQALTSLDVSNFDTSKVTNIDNMFNDCRSLTTLDLSNFDTSNVTSIYKMFYDCRSLTTLDLSNFDTSKVVMPFDMFYSCLALTTLLGPITGIGLNWGDNYKTFDLRYSPLDNASAMVFINGLAEVTTAKTIQFKASTYDTLTPEQIAVATSKGWNVVRSA